MAQKAVLVVFIVAALAFAAAEPERCREYREFEAHIHEIDPARGFGVRAHFVHDAARRRVSVFEEFENQTSRDFFHRLEFFNEGVAYRINLRTHECHHEAITWPWREHHVPHSARFVRSFYLGSQAFKDGGLQVNAWVDEGFDHRWEGSFTDDGCVPVTENVVTNRTGFIHMTYYNFILGISNPDVFLIPHECRRAE